MIIEEFFVEFFTELRFFIILHIYISTDQFRFELKIKVMNI